MKKSIVMIFCQNVRIIKLMGFGGIVPNTLLKYVPDLGKTVYKNIIEYTKINVITVLLP